MSDQGGRAVAWAAVGCAGILVLGFCVATGVAAYLLVTAPSAGPTGEKPSSPATAPWAGNPPPQKPGALRGSLRLAAEVTSVTGSAPVAVGDACALEVDERPRSGGGTWCHTEIRCGSRIVYGGEDRGFFQCAVSGDSVVRGRDDQTTADDGDASLLLDTDARTLTVADDGAGPNGAFGLEARITRVE